MACSKYILTNTGNTIVNFNYQRCDDALWQYQIELNPDETKTIWLLDGTYSINSQFLSNVILMDEGIFPPPTPSMTATLTPTPTPTNVLRTTLAGICHSEASASGACNCDMTATIFVNGTSLANSTLAWSDQYGPNTGDPTGYYYQSGKVYYIDGGCGIGCITGATITEVGSCSGGPTPTPTPTPTVTPAP
jgi:hypothetical protein